MRRAALDPPGLCFLLTTPRASYHEQELHCGCRSNLFAAISDQTSSAPPVPLQSYLSSLELVEKLHFFCPDSDYFHQNIKFSAQFRSRDPWTSQLSSWSLSQDAGLRSAWLPVCTQLLWIFSEASLCQSPSPRAFVPPLQVIISSGKLRAGQRSIELQKLALSRQWRGSSSGCLCISLNPRRRHWCTVISGTALKHTPGSPEGEGGCKATCRLQRGAELRWCSSSRAVQQLWVKFSIPRQ